jgi:hypothetical protein
MSKDFCIIHGYTMRYDMRSGFDLCEACERELHMCRDEQETSGDPPWRVQDAHDDTD